MAFAWTQRHQAAGTRIGSAGRCGHPAAHGAAGQSVAAVSKKFAGSSLQEEAKMRNFILGVVITLLVLGLGGLAVAMLGLLPTTADSTPPRIGRRLAMSCMG